MWSQGQARDFARRYVADVAGSTSLLSPRLRGALLDSLILQIVRSQHAEAVQVSAIDSLREMVIDAVEKKIGVGHFEI